MNPKKFNFEGQEFVVDYISFNLHGVTEKHVIQKIGDKFLTRLNYDYKIVFSDEEIDKHKDSSSYRIYFRFLTRPTWKGCIIHFPGQTAQNFYNQIKKQGIPWRLFVVAKSRITLARFDLCFIQPWNSHVNREELKKLGELCVNNKKKIDEKAQEEPTKNKVNPIIERKEHPRGMLIYIGSRQSSNFFRIYETRKGVRFELELKKFSKTKKLNSCAELLFTHNISDFEDKIVVHYVKSFFKRLDVSLPITHWLLRKYRLIYPTKEGNSFFSTYFAPTRHQTDQFRLAYQLCKVKEPKINDSWNFREEEAYFVFIQLCNFLTTRKGSDTLKSQIYEDLENSEKFIPITFTLLEFLSFLQIKKTNQPCRERFITYFQVLQTATISLDVFDDESFLSATSFTHVGIIKIANIWHVSMKVSTRLLNFRYPFFHSSYFAAWHTTDDLSVKMMILRSFNRPGLTKVLPIQQFLKGYKLSSGTKRKGIKKLVLKALDELKAHKFIEPNFSIIKKGKKDDSFEVLEIFIKDMHKYKTIAVIEIVR